MDDGREKDPVQRMIRLKRARKPGVVAENDHPKTANCGHDRNDILPGQPSSLQLGCCADLISPNSDVGVVELVDSRVCF
eukprot:5652825-Amphidinium_carterae.1